MGIHVRPASRKDMTSVTQIERSSFSDPYPPQLLEALAFAKLGEFLVAEVEGKVVGYISVIIPTLDLASITSLAVHAAYRRKRIAYVLITAALNSLRGRMVNAVKLEVRASNDAAKRLYESFGFIFSHREVRYYEDGEDALVLRLMLRQSKVKA